MNVYVVMSHSARTGEMKAVSVNVNRCAAENAARHAVENYIRYTGTEGDVGEDENSSEFWPVEAPSAFRVKIDTLKVYINFANR